jgi:uncharacterized protein (DUF1015 family)
VNRFVARFRPFRGIRYPLAPAGESADLSAVSAPPYDVIDEEERASLEARDPHNSVRLILPRDEHGGADRYEAAAARLRSWEQAGVLGTDTVARFYRYRMTYTDDAGAGRTTDGVLGDLRLPDPDGPDDARGVLPHERTMPKAKSDRLALLRATRANLDPIWGLSLTEGLSGLLAGTTTTLAHAVDPHGVHHELFAIDDPDVATAIADAVDRTPVVLADGHHRFETAGNYRAEQLAAGRDDPGAGGIMALVVELAEEQLSVGPIHRLLRGTAGTDLAAALAGTCTVESLGANTPEHVTELERRMQVDGGLGLVQPSGLALLRPRAEVVDPRLAELPPEVRSVDSARFEVAVRPSAPDAELTFRDDAPAVAALVEKGAADAAVLLRPVTVSQIRAAAFAGVRMPEKTTFFQPKPRTGFVFRSLDL